MIDWIDYQDIALKIYNYPHDLRYIHDKRVINPYLECLYEYDQINNTDHYEKTQRMSLFDQKRKAVKWLFKQFCYQEAIAINGLPIFQKHQTKRPMICLWKGTTENVEEEMFHLFPHFSLGLARPFWDLAKRRRYWTLLQHSEIRGHPNTIVAWCVDPIIDVLPKHWMHYVFICWSPEYIRREKGIIPYILTAQSIY